MAVNHMVLQGRNVKDVELRTTQTGIENVNFTIAWNEKYKETDRVCFQRCKAWRATAKFIATYLGKKSDEMIVEGTMETEKWVDKDGNNRSENVLMVDKVSFCGRKQGGGETAPAPVEQPTPVDEENLPF